MKKVKTNVLRILEQKHIDYETREYDYDDEHNNGNLLHPLNHLDDKDDLWISNDSKKHLNYNPSENKI